MSAKVSQAFSAKTQRPVSLSIYSCPVSAGFPSPAEGYEEKLDLNEFLIEKPAATFYCRVTGDSMKDAGICDKDILVVDRSILPKNHSIVVAIINGEHTIKRVKVEKNRLWLWPENSAYPPIEIQEGDELTIWGVVVGLLRKYRP